MTVQHQRNWVRLHVGRVHYGHMLETIRDIARRERLFLLKDKRVLLVEKVFSAGGALFCLG